MVMSVALALIVMCVDIEMAGLLMRYFCDFGMFLVLPAVLIYLSLLESARDNTALYGIYHKLLFGITLVTAAMGFLWVLAI